MFTPIPNPIAKPNLWHITAKEKAQAFCNTLLLLQKSATSTGAQEDAPLLDRFTQSALENVTFKPKIINRLLRQLAPDKATGPDHYSFQSFKRI